jgi:hypothetical protein
MSPKDIREFCPIARPVKDVNTVAFFLIKTVEGDMKLERGHWCIKGIQGEFYPIKNDIFLQTYERVDE